MGFAVQPKHFTGGEGSPCFRILRAAGYAVVEKGHAASPDEVPSLPNDMEWAEGRSKLVIHLKKERAPRLAKAKKAEFKRLHGELFCERCKIDPVIEYGAGIGEACIEVHHKFMQVQDMLANHQTKLSDLQCLCANCHRFVQALLKQEKKDSEAGQQTQA